MSGVAPCGRDMPCRCSRRWCVLPRWRTPHCPHSSSSSKPIIPRADLQHRSTSLPSSLAAVASAGIGASQPRFWPVRHGGSLVANGGGIHSTFTAAGARLLVADGTLGLSLAAIGHGQQLEPVSAPAPTRASGRVLYSHGSLSELYANGPYGLEQSFTVARRPLGGTGPLVLALRVGGSLVAQKMGTQIVFKTRAGATALRYGQLSAQDSTGTRLPTAMLLRNGVLELRIDDRRARYPLRIDPFVQQGSKLTGAEESAGDFGWSVALSASGNTALIGGPNDHSLIGAAWVFTRSGSTWTQQGSKLTGGGESGKGAFGYGVGLSSDGNTALIGGPRDNGSVGAAWVFTRSGTTWTQQGSKLTGSGESGKGELGYAVALSSEGNTALLGGPNDVLGTGAAWVFTRSGSTWTQQGSKLTGTGASEFGLSVTLSAFGTTALIGSAGGAAWVFTRSGSTWTQQGPHLTGSGESGKSSFGNSVALSGRREHRADRRLVRQRRRGRHVGVHAFRVDVDAAGLQAHRQRRERQSLFRHQRGAVAGRQHRADRRLLRQTPASARPGCSCRTRDARTPGRTRRAAAGSRPPTGPTTRPRRAKAKRASRCRAPTRSR